MNDHPERRDGHAGEDTRYVVTLRAQPGHPQPPYVRLRHLLKVALRRLGLECLSVHPAPTSLAQPAPIDVDNFDPMTAPPAPSRPADARVSRSVGISTVAHETGKPQHSPGKWTRRPASALAELIEPETTQNSVGLAEMMSGTPPSVAQLRAAGAFRSIPGNPPTPAEPKPHAQVGQNWTAP